VSVYYLSICLFLDLLFFLLLMSVLYTAQANNTHRHIHENHEVFCCCFFLFRFLAFISLLSLFFFCFFFCYKTSIKALLNGDTTGDDCCMNTHISSEKRVISIIHTSKMYRQIIIKTNSMEWMRDIYIDR
jgi:hypothetical protein